MLVVHNLYKAAVMMGDFGPHHLPKSAENDALTADKEPASLALSS